MASSSSYRLAAHYASRYPNKSSSSSSSDGGNRRPPSLEEMLREIPPGETNAYYEKLIESEGFDVSGFPRAYLYGTICPFSIVRDEDRERVNELAKKAIDLYNQVQDNDSSYEFVEVVRASWEVIAGFIYYITFVVKSSTTDQSFQTNFQAKVILEVHKPVVVKFCRPEGSGEKPLHNNPMHLINAYSLLYHRIFTKSEGFDVPDIPNSIRVPGIFRRMKYTDDVEKLSQLCNLSADHYSKEKQVNCRFFKFLKANKRVGRYGDDYHIELLVILENVNYQILQARVCWNSGENPCVELCREKQATPLEEKVRKSEEFCKKLPISSSPKKPKGDEWSKIPTNFPSPKQDISSNTFPSSPPLE